MSIPYLLASLPYLTFNTPAPLSAEAFEAACREQLSEGDAATAVALLRGEPGDAGFARAWAEKETLIRNAIARCRNARRGKDPESATRPTATADVRINGEVDAAFQFLDPSTRDTALEKVRWQVIEELQGVDPLSREALFGYALKLRMNVRRAAMTQEAGLPLAKNFFDAPLPEATEGKTPGDS